MLYKFKLLSLSVLVVFISGCATPTHYMSMPESKLCMDYLTLPSLNIYQSAREQTIARRGIDCSSYSGAANARNRANQNFQNALQGIANMPSSTQYNRGQGTSCTYTRDVVSGMNKICYYNCVGSGHAMTIGAAGICPLTTTR